MAGVAIHVGGLSHRYRRAGGALDVLDNIHFDIAAGEFVALVGRSGVGKTTLLSLLGGLDRVQSGDVVVGAVDLRSVTGDGLAAYRRDTVGFVFQDYGLLPTLTAAENVELAATFTGTSRSTRRRRARELLAAVGLAERADHRPAALSGGESQRVAIARALVNRPALVLADEPTGNLDGENAVAVLALLRSVHREQGCTMVVVTHSDLVAQQTDRVIRLEELALRG